MTATYRPPEVDPIAGPALEAAVGTLSSSIDEKQDAATAATDAELAAESAARAAADDVIAAELAQEVSDRQGADAAHLAALDPHGDRAHSDNELANHVADTDPHADRVYADTLATRARRRDIAAVRALMPLPLFALTSTTAASTGQLDGHYFYADDATPVGNLAGIITIAAGATPTISRYAVFAAHPDTGALTALVAATPNDTALFAATGVRRKAPSTGSEVSGGVWTPTLDAYYFIGALCVTAASLPTFVSGGTLSIASFNIGGGNARTLLGGRFPAAVDLPTPPANVGSHLPRAPVIVGEY
ncbi:MAG: hypothetical protein Q8O56_06240 [Solirubrobacteraceae bacterium]|nr:hypothetical protein [Solirubrobacteraceae bacterium]